MSNVSPQQVIFDVFNQAASAGWVRGEIDYIKVGKTSESGVRAIAGDGSVSYPRIRGTAMDKAIWAIRSQMAQPGSGAWFSATIRLTPDGGFSMDANYDDEPAWDVPVVAGTYVEEQGLFPRDEANQPDWYRQRLREASQGSS